MNIRSLQRLEKVHPDLRRLMTVAARACPVDIEISEGLRSKARQAELYKAGATMTMNSRHLTGHAVDIFITVNGRPRWDWPLYKRAADYIKSMAQRLGIKIKWGGDWRTFKDGPHFELDRKSYP